MIRIPLAKSLLMAAVIMVAGGTPGRSEPIDVRFMPPDIELPKTGVCAPRIRDEDMVAMWTKWDRKSLPKDSAFTTTRDMNRLRDMDAGRYLQIISRIIDLMPTVKPNYGDADAVFDRTRLMIAAGRTDDIKQNGLISKLMAFGSQTPKSKYTLGDLLFQGFGGADERATGLRLKTEAALAGNPDAMLDLTKMAQAGEKIPNWDIDPVLAINLAFGSLVGKLDPGICDRIGRIARAYDEGDLVKRDISASIAWYRLAADLGDSSAAWNVAQYHLRGEDVATDNKLLLRYATQAADGGNMSAILELGGLYAEGAIVARDRDKALFYFDIAEKAGNLAGLIKKVQLFDKTKGASPDDARAYEEALTKLVKNDNSPAWAFTRLARLLQERDGVWQSGGQIRDLLEKAAMKGDVEGKIDLAELLVRENGDAASLTRATDLLVHSIQTDGEIRAVENLVRIYSCISPKRSEEKLGSYWADIEDAFGNDALKLEPDVLAALVDGHDKLTLAALQTHALYGRGSALALYQRYLEETGYSNEVRQLWKDRAAKVKNGAVETSRLQFRLALASGDRSKARNSIAVGDHTFSLDAGLDFARFLIENYSTDPESVSLAKDILHPLAQNGFGRAIKLLAEIESDTPTSAAKIGAYEKAMQQRGDMTAQLLLAESADEPSRRDFFYQRAVRSQRCNYDDTMALAEYAIRQKTTEADRWLHVATTIAGDNGWRKVKIADMYIALNTQDATKTALALYGEARQEGEPAAFYRLVKYYADNGSRVYNPRMASDIFVDLVQRSDFKTMPGKLLMLANMKPEIRRQVSLRINVKELYERSAKGGEPVAMRELAKLLQSDAHQKQDVESAFNWLKRAAEAGDPEAMYLLSQSYAFGTGTEAAPDKAQYWMAKAAEAGSREAKHVLMMTKTGTEG